MYRLDRQCDAALLKTLYTKRHLCSGYLCRLIFLICFNLLSVVNVVSGKINFITFLCMELREMMMMMMVYYLLGYSL